MNISFDHEGVGRTIMRGTHCLSFVRHASSLSGAHPKRQKKKRKTELHWKPKGDIKR